MRAVFALGLLAAMLVRFLFFWLSCVCSVMLLLDEVARFIPILYVHGCAVAVLAVPLHLLCLLAVCL